MRPLSIVLLLVYMCTANNLIIPDSVSKNKPNIIVEYKQRFGATQNKKVKFLLIDNEQELEEIYKSWKFIKPNGCLLCGSSYDIRFINKKTNPITYGVSPGCKSVGGNLGCYDIDSLSFVDLFLNKGSVVRRIREDIYGEDAFRKKHRELMNDKKVRMLEYDENNVFGGYYAIKIKNSKFFQIKGIGPLNDLVRKIFKEVFRKTKHMVHLTSVDKEFLEVELYISKKDLTIPDTFPATVIDVRWINKNISINYWVQ